MNRRISERANGRILSLPLVLVLLVLLLLSAALLTAGVAFGGAPAGKTSSLPAHDSGYRPVQSAPTAPRFVPAISPTTPPSTPPPSCGPAWRIVPSPGGYQLFGVAAVSANDVWAVGGNPPTQIEHWNGSAWSIVPSPNPCCYNSLRALAAVSSNDVWAVGDSGTNPFYTLIEHWNGSAWSVVPSPNPGSSVNWLFGVAAVSANDVWAVGKYEGPGFDHTLIEHWDGSVWSVVPSPAPGMYYNTLYAVTAVSANDVWAVGYYDSGSLILHWNGSSWSVVPSPSMGNGYLYAVAAVSANDVWAVGSGPPALIEHWDGSAWSIVPSPAPGTNSSLFGVAAVSANDVWAVGNYNGSGYGHTLTEHWDGGAWSVVPSPYPSNGSSLYGVAAAASNNVWAVGYGSGISLVEHYSDPCVGSVTPSSTPTATRTATACTSGWTVLPNPAPPVDSALYGVTAFSPNDLWAVGYYSSVTSHTLTLHNTGAGWTVVPSPDPGSGNVILSGVAGVAPDNVWAVGSHLAGNNWQTLTEHWNGTAWSIVPSPNGYRPHSRLYAVTAIASNNVWAVGNQDNGGIPSEVLIEHWDGSAWSYQIGPQPNSILSRLYGVAAAGPADVWAVGTSGLQPLIDHWDGTSWSVVPNPVQSDGTLYGVAVVAANDVWAVGNYYGSNQQTLTEHWDGTQWSVVPSPSPGGVNNVLRGVSAVSANNIWAVGYTDQPAPVGGVMTLAEHWNGTAWSVVSTPGNPTGRDYFYGVATTAAGTVWAVGEMGCTANCYRAALIARYDPPCTSPTPTTIPTITSTVTRTPTRTPALTATPCYGTNPVQNPGFETGSLPPWVISDTAALPMVTTSQPHSGNYSVLIGRVLGSGFNGNSSIYQQVTVPASGGTLSFWYYAVTCDHCFFDYQDAYITDLNGNVLATVMHIGQEYGHWTNQTYDLAAFAGQTVRIEFLVHDDGFCSCTYMYVDDVAILVPGECPTGTPSSTPSPTPSRTPTVTPTATPCYGTNPVQNPGFETGSLPPWVISDTAALPIVTTAQPHSGNYSVLLGTVSGPEPTGDSSIYQQITVPASGGTLSFWYNPRSNAHIGFDFQDVYITDLNGNILAIVMERQDDTYTWTYLTYSMAAFAGQTVRVEFLVHQDGVGDLCSMYVDDVAVLVPGVCATATSPATTATPASTLTITPSQATSTRTVVSSPIPLTPTFTSTISPTPAGTAPVRTATPTSTSCPIQFTDVPQGSTFYTYVRCLACRGIVSGYDDHTFRPYNNITRGQISKMVSNAAGFEDPIPSGQQSYQDVPSTNPFWLWIERLTLHGAMSGYPCGGPGEPCGPGNLPYFRPFNNATRGQIAKIVAIAYGGYPPPAGQTFEDVPPTHTFYHWIEQLAEAGVIGGYPCGGPGEPCGPGNRPYFRPFNNVTRGQAAKIVANTFFPSCQTPERKQPLK